MKTFLTSVQHNQAVNEILIHRKSRNEKYEDGKGGARVENAIETEEEAESAEERQGY